MRQSHLQAAYYITPEHPCSYLDYETAQMIFIDPEYPIDWSSVSHLSRDGFRRSGDFLYRPHCPECRQCQSCRILVRSFIPDSMHKKVLHRNRQVSVQVLTSDLLHENAFKLYARYIEARHSDGDMYPASGEQFEKFVRSEHPFTFYLGFFSPDNQLLAISVCDQLDDGISAVYTFYDPSLPKQSLGTFAILTQIQLASLLGLPYVYLGYWVKDSPKMRYKTRFSPLEIYSQGRWRQHISTITP